MGRVRSRRIPKIAAAAVRSSSNARAEDGAKTVVLVDMSPDLRSQLLDVGVEHLDAILLTHPHADHTHGIDDVRPLVIQAKRKIDLYMDEETAVVRRHFDYIFETPEGSYYPPLLNDKRLTPAISARSRDQVARSRPCRSGSSMAKSLRSVSVRRRRLYARSQRDPGREPTLSRKSRSLDRRCAALYRASEPFLLARDAEWIDRLKPKRAIFTNLHTDLDFGRLERELPPHIEPAYDGMRITV